MEQTNNEKNRFGINTRITFSSASVTGVPGHRAGKGCYPLPEVDPKRIAKVLMHFTGICNVILGSVMDTAETYMVDAESAIRMAGMYKRDIKFRMKIAREKFDAQKRVYYANVAGREQLYMDMLDKVQDDIAPDLKKQYFSILAVLKKHNIGWDDMKAKLEVAWMALYLACKVYEGVVAGSTHLCGTDTATFFSPLNPKDVFAAWEKLCTIICDYDDATTRDISTDKNVNLAFDIILNKLCDSNYVDNRCREVLDEHPEFNKRRHELEAKMQEDKIRDAASEALDNEKWRRVTKTFKIRQ